eukprot:GHVN01035184.1.p1 GENE.GHVN01035184.1~~GHVN01035184.1.p1  ORF type:complete len:923 (-),score=96.93 GHVN01035184.1:1255-4023(-)
MANPPSIQSNSSNELFTQISSITETQGLGVVTPNAPLRGDHHHSPLSPQPTDAPSNSLSLPPAPSPPCASHSSEDEEIMASNATNEPDINFSFGTRHQSPIHLHSESQLNASHGPSAPTNLNTPRRHSPSSPPARGSRSSFDSPTLPIPQPSSTDPAITFRRPSRSMAQLFNGLSSGALSNPSVLSEVKSRKPRTTGWRERMNRMSGGPVGAGGGGGLGGGPLNSSASSASPRVRKAESERIPPHGSSRLRHPMVVPPSPISLVQCKSSAVDGSPSVINTASLISDADGLTEDIINEMAATEGFCGLESCLVYAIEPCAVCCPCGEFIVRPPTSPCGSRENGCRQCLNYVCCCCGSRGKHHAHYLHNQDSSAVVLDGVSARIYRRTLIRRRVRHCLQEFRKTVSAFSLGGWALAVLVFFTAGLMVVKAVGEVTGNVLGWAVVWQAAALAWLEMLLCLLARILIRIVAIMVSSGTKFGFIVVALLDSTLAVLVWSVLATSVFIKQTDGESKLDWEPIDDESRQRLIFFHIIIIVLATRSLVLDAIMLLANLGFSMVLRAAAARLLMAYEAFSSLDAAWWTTQMNLYFEKEAQNNPMPNVDYLHLDAESEAGMGTTTQPPHSLRIRPDMRLSFFTVGGASSAFSGAHHYSMLKKKTKQLRKLRQSQADGGRAGNYFALEFLKQNAFSVIINGNCYDVQTPKAASSLAREMFLELLSFQRHLDALERRSVPLLVQTPSGRNPEPIRRQVAGRLRQRELRLRRQTVALMLGKEMSDEFMTVVDVTGSGKVSSRALVKAVETTLDERESLLNSREAREGIALVFKTLVSAMLWLVAVFIMLIIIGVDFETIVLSGAAVIASLTVALGVFYTNFFKAALFILLHDPYNHGDRVRVNGGEVLIVEHIRAYTTLFVSVYGKPVCWSQSTL